MNDRRTRRAVLGLAGTTAAAGLSGCTGLLSDGSEARSGATDAPDDRETESPSGTESTPENATERSTDEPAEQPKESPLKLEKPDGKISSVSVPKDAAKREYPVAGTGTAPVRVTLYGGWKCPYTKRFVLDGMGDLLEAFVEPGDVDLEFRAVPYSDGEPFHGPDEPGLARAGQAVWHGDPESFWSFFAYVFHNYRRENGWYTADRIEAIADAAGVSDDADLDAAVESDKYADLIDATMKRVRSIPISTVPRIVVDGETYTPTANPGGTRSAIEAAVRKAKRK
ncbi:DsbA family protein [Halegenticoccus soli]|uniref:DsbA family protein n=1 Tax=Halegenticoccus soli TaxID=1985678 RepID=UPI000C6EFB27|nr:thioredoxin domain-containing protein [Halegenticoccus soli]